MQLASVPKLLTCSAAGEFAVQRHGQALKFPILLRFETSRTSAKVFR